MRKLITTTTLRLLITGFLLAMLPVVRAQSGTETGGISGRVANAATRLYLEGAKVSLKDANQSVLTDSTGRFELPSLPPGNYTLMVSYLGLDPFEEKITVKAGETTTREVALQSEVYNLEAFTVVGEREGNAKAMTLQRNSANLRNIVDTEAFGSIADGNVGDFVKLLPGVSAEGRNSETFAMRIRGLDPALNNVTIDGFRATSAGLDTEATRSFEIGLTPIDGLSTIELTKSPTPSQPADSIGGAINLISRSALDRQYNGMYVSGSFGAAVRSYRNNTVYNGKITFQDQYAIFGSEKRNLAISLTYSSNDNYIPIDRVQQTWDNAGLGILNEVRVLDSRITRRRAGATLNVDYRLSESTIFRLRTGYDNFDQKSYERYFAWGRTSLSIQDWRYWKKQETQRISLSAEHKVSGWKIDYGAQFLQSASDNVDTDGDRLGGRVVYSVRNATAFTLIRPESTGLKFTTVNQSQTGGLDALNPNNWILSNNNYRLRDIFIDKTAIDSNFNAERTFEIFGLPVKTKHGFGIADEFQKKLQDQKQYTLYGADGVRNTADDQTLFGGFFSPGSNDYPLFRGSFLFNGKPYAPLWIDHFALGQHLRQNPSLWRNAANPLGYNLSTYNENYFRNNYTLTETIMHAYTQGSFTLGNFNVLTGVRFEKTKVAKRGHDFDSDLGQWSTTRTRKTNEYHNYFPSIHTKYHFTSDLTARASFSKTIGRPSISQLVREDSLEDDFDPLQPVDSIANAIILTESGLNLRPQRSDNVDVSLEYYFKQVGAISVGYFQKDIKDFLERGRITIDLPGGRKFITNYTRNLPDKATVEGFEFSYQQQITFLPGSLRRTSGFANYTYIEAQSAKRSDAGGGTETGAITNFVPQIINAGISWRDYDFDMKLRYSWTDDYLRTDSANPAQRVYYSEYSRFDLNTRYEINDKLSIYLDIFNIFNSPVIYYRGGKGLNVFQTQYEDNGTRYSMGLNIRL